MFLYRSSFLGNIQRIKEEMGRTNVTIKQGKINDKPPAIIYTLQYIALVINCNSINEVFSKLNRYD